MLAGIRRAASSRASAVGVVVLRNGNIHVVAGRGSAVDTRIRVVGGRLRACDCCVGEHAQARRMSTESSHRVLYMGRDVVPGRWLMTTFIVIERAQKLDPPRRTRSSKGCLPVAPGHGSRHTRLRPNIPEGTPMRMIAHVVRVTKAGRLGGGRSRTAGARRRRRFASRGWLATSRRRRVCRRSAVPDDGERVSSRARVVTLSRVC